MSSCQSSRQYYLESEPSTPTTYVLESPRNNLRSYRPIVIDLTDDDEDEKPDGKKPQETQVIKTLVIDLCKDPQQKVITVPLHVKVNIHAIAYIPIANK